MSALICFVESVESLWHTFIGHYKSEKLSDSRTNYIDHQTNQLIKAEKDQQQTHIGRSLIVQDNSCATSATNSLLSDEDPLFRKWMFHLIDENKDGFVSIQEINLLLQRLGCTDMSEEAIAAALLHPHNPKYNETQHLSTLLDFAQFTNLYESIMLEVPNSQFCLTDGSTGTEHNSTESTESRFLDNGEDASDVDTEDQLLYEAFRLYDKNGDGFISASEMTSVLTELGLLQDHSISSLESKNAYCQTLIDRVDVNGDGLVDLDEFKLMMLNPHQL